MPMITSTPTSQAIEIDERPWGRFTVLLDLPHTKVKRIEVRPGHRLSLQKHFKREEHWIMTKGSAQVHLNSEILEVSAGDTVFIPKEAVHRIHNASSDWVEFIEVQLGDYFGEDDIVRLEDDYQRT